MPFINEQLANNQQITAQKKHTQKAARPSRFRFDPATVMKTLSGRIIGQEPALNIVEDMLFSIKADFCAPNRPLGVLFFLGPTGVGKTETVRVLSEAILGNTEKLCRIDMNTLAQEHYSAAITGSPPGYVGSKEGQTLFNVENIRGSFSEPGIVLFDEIEKANKDVVRAILNIFDSGKLTLTSGVKEIDFSNSIIFMTSNIGVKEVTDYIAKYQKGWRRLLKRKPSNEENILQQALHSHFDPEFLNRIDQIVRFKRLDNDRINALISIEIDKLNARLQRRKASIKIDASVKKFLSLSYDDRFGARDIARRIRRELEPKIARALLSFPQAEVFSASMQKQRVIVTPTN